MAVVCISELMMGSYFGFVRILCGTKLCIIHENSGHGQCTMILMLFWNLLAYYERCCVLSSEVEVDAYILSIEFII